MYRLPKLEVSVGRCLGKRMYALLLRSKIALLFRGSGRYPLHIPWKAVFSQDCMKEDKRVFWISQQ